MDDDWLGSRLSVQLQQDSRSTGVAVSVLTGPRADERTKAIASQVEVRLRAVFETVPVTGDDFDAAMVGIASVRTISRTVAIRSGRLSADFWLQVLPERASGTAKAEADDEVQGLGGCFNESMAKALSRQHYARAQGEMHVVRDLMSDPTKSDVAYDPERGEATFTVSGPPQLTTIDLSGSPLFQPPPNKARGAPYDGTRSYGGRWNADPAATDINLFLIVNRCGSDHSLTYAFFEGAPLLAEVTAWTERNASTFGMHAAVIDLGQSFSGLDEAADEASRLREAMPRANVMSGRLD